VLQRAISRLTPGMVVVAAAGNHGERPPGQEQADLADRAAVLFPAALDEVVAVGALDREDRPAGFNPRGAREDQWAPWIDVFAPGTDVVSAYLGEQAEDGGEPGEVVAIPERDGAVPRELRFRGWARWSGTSFAAARVTGEIAALIATGRSPLAAVGTIRRDPGHTGPWPGAATDAP
jgi:subtilisin family serine protease